MKFICPHLPPGLKCQFRISSFFLFIIFFINTFRIIIRIASEPFPTCLYLIESQLDNSIKPFTMPFLTKKTVSF